jgi:hypothetical protein
MLMPTQGRGHGTRRLSFLKISKLTHRPPLCALFFGSAMCQIQVRCTGAARRIQRTYEQLIRHFFIAAQGDNLVTRLGKERPQGQRTTKPLNYSRPLDFVKVRALRFSRINKPFMEENHGPAASHD